MMETKLVLLGTGTPNACPDASGPSSAVVVGDRAYLVDFGPGVVRQAAKAYRNGIDALRPDRLVTAFCTHLHTDHTAGYPDLIFTPWVLERKEPLRVFGPKGIRDMTEHLLQLLWLLPVLSALSFLHQFLWLTSVLLAVYLFRVFSPQVSALVS